MPGKQEGLDLAAIAEARAAERDAICTEILSLVPRAEGVRLLETACLLERAVFVACALAPNDLVRGPCEKKAR